MKLNALTPCRTDPFHNKLRLGDEFLARITRLAVASAAPDARDTVLGQTAVCELGANEATKGFLFQGAPPWSAVSEGARFTGVSAPQAPTRKAGVQAGKFCRTHPY